MISQIDSSAVMLIILGIYKFIYKDIGMMFLSGTKKWKHNLLLLESSKTESDGLVDLMKYKNHYVLFKNLYVFWVKIIVILFAEDVWARTQVKTL